LLDPRFTSATYLSGSRKYKAKHLLQNEVLYLVMRDWVAEPDEEIFNTGIDINSDDSDEDNDLDFKLNLVGSRIPKAALPRLEDKSKWKAVKHEVHSRCKCGCGR